MTTSKSLQIVGNRKTKSFKNTKPSNVEVSFLVFTVDGVHGEYNDGVHGETNDEVNNEVNGELKNGLNNAINTGVNGTDFSAHIFLQYFFQVLQRNVDVYD